MCQNFTPIEAIKFYRKFHLQLPHTMFLWSLLKLKKYSHDVLQVLSGSDFLLSRGLISSSQLT